MKDNESLEDNSFNLKNKIQKFRGCINCAFMGGAVVWPHVYLRQMQ